MPQHTLRLASTSGAFGGGGRMFVADKAGWEWPDLLLWIIVAISLSLLLWSLYLWGRFELVKIQQWREKQNLVNNDLQIPQRLYDTDIHKLIEYHAERFKDRNTDKCYPETRQKVRQAALNGAIRIWGRKSDRLGGGRWSSVWTLIEPEYWRQAELWPLAALWPLATDDESYAIKSIHTGPSCGIERS